MQTNRQDAVLSAAKNAKKYKRRMKRENKILGFCVSKRRYSILFRSFATRG
jgi:hypothetical protein